MGIEFNEYQRQASETAIYPHACAPTTGGPARTGQALHYPALGLAGEAGEVAELIKKMIRDDDGELTGDRRDALRKELGDVLWYVSELARQAGLSLQEVAAANLAKLSARQEAGTLQGEGSDR